MAPRTRSLLLLLFPGLLGCQLHVRRVEVGSPQSEEAWSALQAGSHDRGDVLDLLGPPDLVTYTVSDEVLEYRQGMHRGSSLRFLLAGLDQQVTILFSFRSLLGLVFRRSAPEELDANNPAAQAAGIATAQVNPIGGLSALELEGRRLRWDVMRLTLDRNTLILKSKERLQGIPESGLGEATRGALLMND